jgi:acetylglutamate/LysW-gamma-L-alpha-aminoadipate kinase
MIVVKIGGAAAVDPTGALADVAAVAGADDHDEIVVVHGGSTAVDDLLDRLGIEPTYVETPAGVTGRFTDEATMAAFTMAMRRVNTDLVVGLRGEGADAVGLSGVDGGLLTGPRKSAVRVVEDGKRKIKRGDHAGRIERVDGDLLRALVADGRVPVVGPPMLADDGVAVNTDADRAAAAVAAELAAELVLLTDVAGVYADPDDPETLIGSVETGEEFAALEDAAEGFMSRKVMAVAEGLGGGATGAVVADANADRPVRAALAGGGTHVAPAAVSEGSKGDGDDDGI